MVVKYGGSPKIWDEGKLDAAINAPKASYGGVRAHKSIFDIAAAYWYHISQAHPFESANKRTAVMSCLTFLRLNDYRIDCSNKDIVSAGYDIATGKMSEKQLSVWLKKRVKSLV